MSSNFCVERLINPSLSLHTTLSALDSRRRFHSFRKRTLPLRTPKTGRAVTGTPAPCLPTCVTPGSATGQHRRTSACFDWTVLSAHQAPQNSCRLENLSSPRTRLTLSALCSTRPIGTWCRCRVARVVYCIVDPSSVNINPAIDPMSHPVLGLPIWLVISVMI